MECFTCNTVWHRTCTDSLPSKGPTLQYWQCDTCVEEEIAEYSTSREQLRPQQPAITAEETETATAEVVQIADASDESQDEEQSDQALDDSETDEEWEEQLRFSPQTQTSLGLKTDYNRLDDYTLAAQDAEIGWLRESVAEMESEFNYQTLSDCSRH